MYIQQNVYLRTEEKKQKTWNDEWLEKKFFDSYPKSPAGVPPITDML